MKQLFSSIIVLLTMGLSLYGQKFVEVAKNSPAQQIILASDEVLSVKLPSTPSTGYSWYVRNTDNNTITQIGDFDFISDTPEESVGASGTQITRFIGTARGTTNLELVYIRPWERAEALDSYKITVVSEGSYTGTYKVAEQVLPVVDATTQSSPSALPAKFSWKDQSAVTPIKNQGSCGSCWAFAACGVFESLILAKDRVTRDLSEQWLVNCAGYSCKGGWCPFKQFTSKGAVYEADVPYQGADGSCKSSYTYHEKSDMQAIDIPNSTEQIKQAIYKYGPVWTAVTVGSSFQGYKSCVLTKSDPGAINHAVVLCGWDDATSSWVLRNSWGASWGEQGYMKIKYGVCSIGSNTAYLVYKGGFTSTGDIDQASAISIYPNPAANGVFNIDGLERENTIEVYDVVGKLVYKTVATATKNTVDLSANQKGVYFYKVSNSSKLVKQGKVVVM